MTVQPSTQEKAGKRRYRYHKSQVGSILPKEGFLWKSYHGTSLIRAHLPCNRVVEDLRRAGMTLGRKDMDELIEQLFRIGIALIKDGGYMPLQRVWHYVRLLLRWAALVDLQALTNFADTIIAGRNLYLSDPNDPNVSPFSCAGKCYVGNVYADSSAGDAAMTVDVFLKEYTEHYRAYILNLKTSKKE
ncbi:hypothetical protein M426DRAFT_257578 [Hypoxylon sp. CI-4A]|nr:hypothetical protein M426DRAFT_257578 [Hypoxylon sp. CI-4A]